MIYLMHIIGTATILAARPSAAQALARAYCRRLARVAIYPLSLSVKPARAVISGRLYPAHIGIVTACA